MKAVLTSACAVLAAGAQLDCNNGLTNWGSVYRNSNSVGYYTITGSRCLLEGKAQLSWGQLSTRPNYDVIVTLPEDCRPNDQRHFQVTNDGSSVRVQVETNGQVKLYRENDNDLTSNWLSLSGVEFVVAGETSEDLSITGDEWIPAQQMGGYRGQGAPGFRVDGDICSLTGIVGTTGSTSSTSTITTLPAGCRPAKLLHFVAATGQGRGVQVDVGPSGDVTYVETSSSSVKYFVSLAGIQFSTGAASGTVENIPYGFLASSDTIDYFTDGKYCLVQGVIEPRYKPGNFHGALFTLPEKCRPSEALYFEEPTETGLRAIVVNTNGEVRTAGSSPVQANWISVDNIKFLRADGCDEKPCLTCAVKDGAIRVLHSKIEPGALAESSHKCFIDGADCKCECE